MRYSKYVRRLCSQFRHNQTAFEMVIQLIVLESETQWPPTGGTINKLSNKVDTIEQ